MVYTNKWHFVDAVQWDESEEAYKKIEALIDVAIRLGERYPGEVHWPHWEFTFDGKWYHFHVGDWIIRNASDEIKIMSDKEFREEFIVK